MKKKTNTTPVVGGYMYKTLPKDTIIYVQYDAARQWKLTAPVRVKLVPYELTPANDPTNKSGLGNG